MFSRVWSFCANAAMAKFHIGVSVEWNRGDALHHRKEEAYLHLGSWNTIFHKPRTPADIWSSALSGTRRVPRVCTSLLIRTLAEIIGSLDIAFTRENSPISSAKSETVCTASCATSDSKESSDEVAEDDKPTMQKTSQNDSYFPQGHGWSEQWGYVE